MIAQTDKKENTMAKLTILSERCKGCLLCTKACPKKLLEASTDTHNAKGYYPVRITRPEQCIGCALCASMCPDCVIIVEK